MPVTLRDSLRRRRPSFTDAERVELLDTLLAERVEAPAPTLSECYRLWVEVSHERDRLTGMVAGAEAALAKLDAICERFAKSGDTFGARQAMAEQANTRGHHDRTIAAARAALAELDAEHDQAELDAGRDRFLRAVDDLWRRHQAVRLDVAHKALKRADEAHQAARRAVDLAAPLPALQTALRTAADAEAMVVVARRRVEAIDQPRRGRR